MKKILFTLTIAILAIASFAQEQEFVPNYGIELSGYSNTQRFATDTINLNVELKLMSITFRERDVHFIYDVKKYNDSTLVYHNSKEAILLPLNATISGKFVYEWLNDLYSPQDTVIIKGLSEKLYYYDLKNK
jgi:hypothetical protein